MKVSTEIRKDLNRFKKEGLIDGRVKKIALKIISHIINFKPDSVNIDYYGLEIKYVIDASLDWNAYILISEDYDIEILFTDDPDLPCIRRYIGIRGDYEAMNEHMTDIYAIRWL